MWKCEVCGEEIDDQFDSCWRCAGAGELGIGAEGSASAFEETFVSSDVCTHCGSRHVVPNVWLADQGQDSDDKSRVKVSGNPNAWLFKGTARAEVIGRLCCKCG